MHSNCIKNLLNLKEVKVRKIKNLENIVEIYIELPISEHICPCCGNKTSIVHDYYHQTIKDVPIQFKPTNIIYRKHRYHCNSCDKNFYENNNIVKRRTNRLTAHIVNELRIAYREKEELLDILHSKEDSNIKINRFKQWIDRSINSDISQLCECAKTYQNWYVEIKHSLEVPYSNGATEGFNNKIKTLKRVSFGMRSFKNFKARIMLLNRN